MARTTTTTKPAAPNKAQAEFDKYTKRRQAQATTSTGSSPMPPSAAAAAGPQATAGPFPGSGLTWAVPLGVGTAPVYFGGPPPGPGAPGPGGAAGLGGAVGGLTEGIGTTLRLGVDLLNAALFNSAKIYAPSAAPMAMATTTMGDNGRGCGCESCCERHAASRTAAAAVLQPGRGELLLRCRAPARCGRRNSWRSIISDPALCLIECRHALKVNRVGWTGPHSNSVFGKPKVFFIGKNSTSCGSVRRSGCWNEPAMMPVWQERF